MVLVVLVLWVLWVLRILLLLTLMRVVVVVMVMVIMLGVVDRVVHLTVVNIVVRELLLGLVDAGNELGDGAEGANCLTVKFGYYPSSELSMSTFLTLWCLSVPRTASDILSAPSAAWLPRVLMLAEIPGAMCSLTTWCMWAALSSTTGLAALPSWATAVTPALPMLMAVSTRAGTTCLPMAPTVLTPLSSRGLTLLPRPHSRTLPPVVL